MERTFVNRINLKMVERNTGFCAFPMKCIVHSNSIGELLKTSRNMFQYQHSKDAFYIGKYIEKDEIYAYVLRGVT